MADVYLDPWSRPFADAVAKEQPVEQKTYKAAREGLEEAQNFKPAPDIKIEEVSIEVQGENVTTVIFRRADATGTLPMVFYTHGGGWVLGRNQSPRTHGSLMEDLARQTGAAIVFPYYTPAPEAQFPKQYEQGYGVLEHVVKNGSKLNIRADKISLSGDSAGGHMAVAMCQLAQARNLPAKIGELVLFYPTVETHMKTETYKIFKNGPYVTESVMDWFIEAFIPNPEDRRKPLTSPLTFAPDDVLAKFPPTTIFVSGADVMIGEGKAFGHRLQQLGVDAAVLQADGQVHDFAMLEALRGSPTSKAVVELASWKLKKGFS